jgi:hypothetical protein
MIHVLELAGPALLVVLCLFVLCFVVVDWSRP